jgi:hypothetical protein
MSTELVNSVQDALTISNDEFVTTVEQEAERLDPAEWKHREVSRRIEEGTPLTAAVREMQTTYVER